TGRPAAISNARLLALADELLPVKISGDPVQYQINRNDAGWVVELVNNEGVIKEKDRPAVVVPEKAISVTVTPRINVNEAQLWTQDGSQKLDMDTPLVIPSGESRFVAFQVE